MFIKIISKSKIHIGQLGLFQTIFCIDNAKHRFLPSHKSSQEQSSHKFVLPTLSLCASKEFSQYNKRKIRVHDFPSHPSAHCRYMHIPSKNLLRNLVVIPHTSQQPNSTICIPIYHLKNQERMKTLGTLDTKFSKRAFTSLA